MTHQANTDRDSRAEHGDEQSPRVAWGHSLAAAASASGPRRRSR